jgi:hypothetical protein
LARKRGERLADVRRPGDDDAHGRHEGLHEHAGTGRIEDPALAIGEAARDFRRLALAGGEPSLAGRKVGDDGQRLVPAPCRQDAVERLGIALALKRFQQDLDLAAAGKARAPRGLLVDAELEQLGRSTVHYVRCFRDHVDLDAAARHRAVEPFAWSDDHLAADRHRRRAPGGRHCRECDTAVLIEPAPSYLNHVALGVAGPLGGDEVHDMPRHEITWLVLTLPGTRRQYRPRP